jgi:predicted DNA-binding transcriptional regulator YafY
VALASEGSRTSREGRPEDIFHPERARPAGSNRAARSGEDDRAEAQAITVFLRCILARQAVELAYHSPYTGMHAPQLVVPYGILWDRDRWYLVGTPIAGGGEPQLWRADRVISIAANPQHVECPQAFNIEQLLNRKWLDRAMADWTETAPVIIRMTHEQAARLKHDWYYAHAHFEALAGGDVSMTFGESNRAFVFELLRWLGPGAELVEPQPWRAAFAVEVRAMLSPYEG